MQLSRKEQVSSYARECHGIFHHHEESFLMNHSSHLFVVCGAEKNRVSLDCGR